MGPVSMVTGSTPARAKVWNVARGVRPSSAAFSSLMISTAEAPSVICELLAAVTLPPWSSGTKAGFSLARLSMEESRMPSSARSTSSVSMSSPVSLSRGLAAIGTISLSKRPSSRARAAFCWLRRPKASRSSRLRPHFSAMTSAETPWGMRPLKPKYSESA